MSLKAFEGFNAYAFLSELEDRWVHDTDNNNSALLLDGGQNERGALQFGTNSRAQDTWYWDVDGAGLNAEWVIGFWFKYESFDSTDFLYDAFLKFNSTTTTRASMRISSDGSIQFRRLTTSTEYFDSKDTNETFDGEQHYLFPGGEYKIELKISFINSTGSVELRVNDEIWWKNDGGVDLDGTINRLYFTTGEVGSGAKYSISDVYVVWDDATDPSTFLGSAWQVEVLEPTSDSGTEADFTPSTGINNYAMVDDGSPHDADGTYVSSSVDTNIDRYLTTGVLASQKIWGVNVRAVARHEGAADNFRLTIFENATAENGSTEALTDTWAHYWHMSITNPDTAAAWEKADLEGSEFGVENVA